MHGEGGRRRGGGKKELKPKDLIFPSLNLTWVYRELNHRWKSSIWLLRARLKSRKINLLELLSLEEQLFSTSKIILKCCHQMFISSAQNTCSRDNTGTANKTYNHADWNAAGFKHIVVPLPHRLLVSVRWWWVTQSHTRNAVKSAH